MTQADVDRRVVILELGFAAVRPSEYVIVRIEVETS